MRRILYILTTLAFLAVLPLSADTVLLRTGQAVEGTIVSQSRTDIRIQTPTGIQTLQKANVQRVIYGSDAARVAEEKRVLEEQRKQEEAKKQEELRKQEEARKAEEKRKAGEGKAGKTTPETTQTAGPGRWAYTWRSMVLPGWGHMYRGDAFTGYAYMGGFGLALATVAWTQNNAQQAKSTYASEVLMNKVKGIAIRNGLGGGTGTGFVALLYMRQADADVQKSYKEAVTRNKSALGVLGALYVGQLAHLTFFGSGPTASLDSVGSPVRIFAAALPGPDRSWTSTAGFSLAF